MVKILTTCLFLLSASFCGVIAQGSGAWKGKKAAVVLTYDDALNVHLDNVVPALDSAGMKGTFYLIGESPVVASRLKDWRAAAKTGHELGNHSLRHPCDGSIAGRTWLTAENDLSRYSVARAVAEIRICNTLLQSIDGKTKRTFAFPCGDTRIDTVAFYNQLKSEFVAARGVKDGLESVNETNLDDVRCYSINGQSGKYMVDLAREAITSGNMIVFLFHGVGGEHNLNVSLEAHRELIRFLKEHKKEVWVTPMVDAAEYIRTKKHSAKQ